jgi:urease accessory protein
MDERLTSSALPLRRKGPGNLSAARQQIFAGNRAVGRIALVAGAAQGVTRRLRVHEAGSLRVRFPNGNGKALDAVIVNTAGGMAGGDRFTIDLTAGAGAQVGVTTAAAEKVYRTLGADTEIAVRLNVETGATLAWLPQETILFDRARVRRSIDVTLAPGATLLLAEGIVFGRTAMGEEVHAGTLCDRWRIRHDGALVFAETVRLEGNIARRLATRAIAAGARAIASMIKVPGDEAMVAGLRALERGFAGEVGVSAWNGFAVARFVAADGAALRHDLALAAAALGGAPLPRLWLN